MRTVVREAFRGPITGVIGHRGSGWGTVPLRQRGGYGTRAAAVGIAGEGARRWEGSCDRHPLSHSILDLLCAVGRAGMVASEVRCGLSPDTRRVSVGRSAVQGRRWA